MPSTQRNDRMPALFVSLELACRAWKVAATQERRAHPAIHALKAEGLWDRFGQLLALIEQLKRSWGLPSGCRVALIYEAGQDGFWIARKLQAAGIEVIVIDPASVCVPRHAKRAKTDRLDALKLLEELCAWLRGERGRLRVVHIPSAAAEAQRMLARERGLLQKEIEQHRDRASKLLRLYGCTEKIDARFVERLTAGQVRCADGSPLPEELWDRLMRECERLDMVERQFRKLEKSLMKQLPEDVQQRITQLEQLKAVGRVGASRLMLELFWRNFNNRRQVGACVGLVPQPYDSGDSHVDQGISKQGNRRVRSLLIEMAWMWLRYQPNSELAQWFARRTTGSGKRGKRIAIVAVARRLAIDLWRYLRDGLMPPGAELKPT